MLPSVTTGTTNSDTITETFATAQNSPTSETTTLTSSIALPATTIPESNSMSTGQATPAKGAATSVSSPPPSSTPKVAPLVDLSDTPSSTPATNNLSSSVLSNQGAVLSPSAVANVAETSKVAAGNKPAAASPANLTSPPAPSEPKQEVSSTKSPEKEAVQSSTVKSPTETTKNPSNLKSEAASGSTTNPSQNEDFKMDEGTFKTPDIDLAKDVFAALGTTTPASVTSGQARELASSTADSSVPAAPSKTEYGWL